MVSGPASATARTIVFRRSALRISSSCFCSGNDMCTTPMRIGYTEYAGVPNGFFSHSLYLIHSMAVSVVLPPANSPPLPPGPDGKPPAGPPGKPPPGPPGPDGPPAGGAGGGLAGGLRGRPPFFGSPIMSRIFFGSTAFLSTVLRTAIMKSLISSPGLRGGKSRANMIAAPWIRSIWLSIGVSATGFSRRRFGHAVIS